MVVHLLLTAALVLNKNLGACPQNGEFDLVICSKSVETLIRTLPEQVTLYHILGRKRNAG